MWLSLFNVPYCPEYNSIELVFSKVKSILRKKSNNHITNNLLKNLKNSINKITENNLSNYYKKSLSF